MVGYGPRLAQLVDIHVWRELTSWSFYKSMAHDDDDQSDVNSSDHLKHDNIKSIWIPNT